MATGETYTQANGLKQSYLNLMKLIAKDRTPLTSKYFKKGTKPVSRVHLFSVDTTTTPTAVADVATIEGAELTASAPDAFTQNENYVEDFRIVKHVSTVQQAVEYMGVDNFLSKQEEKALLQLAINQEYAIINSTGAAGASATARQMRGLAYWATASGNTATAAAASATETPVNSVLEQMYSDGCPADLVIAAPATKRAMDAWTANGATRYIMVKDKEVTATVNVYDSTYGRVALLMHTLCPAKSIFAVMADAFKISYLTEPKITPLGRVSGGFKFEAEVNSTLEVVAPLGCGKVTIS